MASRPALRDLPDHLWDQPLAGESWVHRHNQNHVEIRKHILDGGKGSGRIQSRGRLRPVPPDHAEDPLQMLGGFDMHGNILPGPGMKEFQKIFGPLDHEMDVQGNIGRFPESGAEIGPEGQVRHKTAIHNVDVIRSIDAASRSFTTSEKCIMSPHMIDADILLFNTEFNELISETFHADLSFFPERHQPF